MLNRIQELFESGAKSILINNKFVVTKLLGGYAWFKDGIPISLKVIYDECYDDKELTFKTLSESDPEL